MNDFYYIANIRLPTEKAHGVQIMNMCQSFNKAGQNVHLVVPKRATTITGTPFDYYGMPAKFEVKRIWCLDWVRFGWFGFWSEILSFALSASVYAVGKKGIFYTREWLIALFLKLFGKKVFLEVHTAKDNFLIRFLIARGIGVVAITGGLKDFYENLGVKKILVAHDGVDLARFKLTPEPHQGIVFGYIGKYTTMGEGKGVDEIIKAFIDLGAPNTTLKIVGLNPGEEIAKHEGVVAIAHLPPKDVPAHILSCDVLVMNYPDTPHYRHFMSPLKLFEYMAAGRAIITSDLPSLREILDDNEAYYFEAGNTAKLKEAMQRVIKNPDEAREVGRLARAKAEEYTWDKRAELILNFTHA